MKVPSSSSSLDHADPISRPLALPGVKASRRETSGDGRTYVQKKLRIVSLFGMTIAYKDNIWNPPIGLLTK